MTVPGRRRGRDRHRRIGQEGAAAAPKAVQRRREEDAQSPRGAGQDHAARAGAGSSRAGLRPARADQRAAPRLPVLSPAAGRSRHLGGPPRTGRVPTAAGRGPRGALTLGRGQHRAPGPRTGDRDGQRGRGGGGEAAALRPRPRRPPRRERHAAPARAGGRGAARRGDGAGAGAYCVHCFLCRLLLHCERRTIVNVTNPLNFLLLSSRMP